MTGYDIVAESYEEFNNPVKRNRIKYANKLLSCLPCASCNCFSKKAERIANREIAGQWPNVVRADQPDNIKWENMGYPASEKRAR
jgi:hypothetical protein